MLSLLLLKVPELVPCSNPTNQSVFCNFLFSGSITAQKWHFLLVSCLTVLSSVTTFAFLLALQSAYLFCWKRNSSEVRSFGVFEYTSRLMIVGDTCNFFIFFYLFYNLKIILFRPDLYDGTNLGLTGVNID